MASGLQSVFVEESDNDVNTTSTEEDYDPDKEYDVECVLSEMRSDNGKMYFLIKWEGYPLYDATWETKDSITSDVVLRHWDRDKREIRAGKKEAFDVEIYNQAFEARQDELDRKRRARLKKRSKRGEIVDDDEDEDGDDSAYELPTTETPKRTRVKVVSSPVKKKGVAQPLPKKRNTLSERSPVENEIPPGSQASEIDSLFGEPIRRDTTPPRQSSGTAKASTTTREVSPPKSTVPTTPKPYTGTASTTKPFQAQPTAQSKPSASNTGPSATSARKSAPNGTVGTAKPPSKSKVFANWNDPKKPRQRKRSSGNVVIDSFKNLKHQNNVQKYGKNEPPPDPNALVMVDPKTGAREPLKQVPLKTGPEDIHSAYGRRSPVRARQRTPSPSPSPPRRRPSEAQVRVEQASVPVTDPALQTTYSSAVGRLAKIRQTCRYWKEGNCQYTSDTCRFIHADVPGVPSILPKKLVTCYYWRTTGRCKKSDEECEFCHYWTDEVAGPPGSYVNRRRSMVAADSVPVSDVGQMRIASPSEQFFTPSSPIEQFGGTAAVIQPPPPPPPQPPPVQPVQTTNEPPTVPAESITDPRLRGRALRMSDGISVGPNNHPKASSAVEQQKEPTPTITNDVEMTDAIDVSHGSPEQDLAMAKVGIRNLDSIKLLTLIGSDGKPRDIQNVYIHMPDRPEELALLEKYFRDLNRSVYTSNAVSGWTFFSSKCLESKNSLLIVHPTELFAGTLPGLFNLFITYGASFPVFSIGVQHARCIREKRKPAYESQRLFPHGGMTFITDDVFVYYPEKATQIIEDFLKETDKMPAKFHQRSKIAARPGIKAWLLRLATKKMEEHAGDEAIIPYVKAYDAICRLCPLEDEDPAFPGQHVPLESSFLFSPSADSLPSFQSMWESGDEEGATDYMANFFAGEACGKVWKYRKFHFVYQRPPPDTMETDSEPAKVDVDPKGWGRMYNHIGVVPADQFLRKPTQATNAQSTEQKAKEDMLREQNSNKQKA